MSPAMKLSVCHLLPRELLVRENIESHRYSVGQMFGEQPVAMLQHTLHILKVLEWTLSENILRR